MSRLDKISSLLKKEISQILIHKVNDSRVNLVSIIDISVSPDLRNAKVYYSVMGDEEKRKKTHFALKSATKYIKSELGKVLQFPTVPHPRFIFVFFFI